MEKCGNRDCVANSYAFVTNCCYTKYGGADVTKCSNYKSAKESNMRIPDEFDEARRGQDMTGQKMKCTNLSCDYHNEEWLSNCSNEINMKKCPSYRSGEPPKRTKYVNIRQEKNGTLYISGVHESSKIARKWAARIDVPALAIAIPVEIPGEEV